MDDKYEARAELKDGSFIEAEGTIQEMATVADDVRKKNDGVIVITILRK